jgi:phosphoglycerol transferase MdoB-like AlkP superfamily enzyme
MIAWIQARAAPIVAFALFAAPLLAFVLVITLVKGHASLAYYDAVSQIVPVVILALAIELRYFSPNRQLPEPLKARFRRPELAQPIATAYAVATLLALITSEIVSLAVVASNSSGRLALSLTAAGLAAGGCALVAAILLPSGDGGSGP